MRLRSPRPAVRALLSSALILSLAGCGAMTGKTPRGATPAEETKPAPKPASLPKKKVPGTRQTGPVLDMRHWKIQCSNESLAMLCRKSDRTDRRCAVNRSGKYHWTYGSYCDASLPCYKKACR